MDTRYENTGDITVKVSPNETLTVENLTMDEQFDVERVYGSGFVAPSGYSIKRVEYGGSMTLNGNQNHLNDYLFHTENGVRVPKVLDAVTVHHLPENPEAPEDEQVRETTAYKKVIVTNKGYEANDGEITQTSYEFVAMRVD